MQKIFFGWWVVGGAFVLLFCSVGTQFYAFPVFFEAIVSDMGWSRAQTAAALSFGTLVAGAIGPIIGILMKKIRLRLIMISGSITASVGFLLLSTVSELWQLYVFYGLVLSIGIACIQLIPNLAAVESWFTQKKSTALGIASAGIGAGGAIMAPLAGWLISRYDWQTAFIFLAAIVTLIGVPISALVMRTREEGKSGLTERQENPATEGATLGQALKQRAFWLASIGALLWAWAYSAALIHQVAFAVDIGIDRLVAAGAVGLLTTFSIPGRLGFGRLGDIIDKRYVFMMGATLQIVAFIVLMRATNVTMLYIYSFLIGVNIGGLSPILPGLLADYFGRKHFGVIYGTSHFMLTLGAMIGPIYAGWVFDITESYSIAFQTSLVLSFIAMIAVYLVGRPRWYYTK